MKKIIHLLVVTLQFYLLIASNINEEVSLALTVYNNRFAIVKDVRKIFFDKGRSDLYFTDVSSNIQTETVTFKALNNTKSIKIFQQNYQANLISDDAILQKFIGKEIKINYKAGQKLKKVIGTLLSYKTGYILKTNKGIKVLRDVSQITFPSLPQGLLTVPTLNWKIFSEEAVTSTCEVAYRTTGFQWKSDYSLTLSEDEKKADVGGWVTIVNNSGKRYKDAKLKLIAGDVNTASGDRYERFGYYDDEDDENSEMYRKRQKTAPSFSEKSFSDYHMYTLSDTVTLEEQSQKQIEFIPKVYDVPVRKYNLILINSGRQSQENLKAFSNVQISNTQDNGLGIPLPKGTVRLFKADEADDSLEFIGQNTINHTPKDENITVNIGKAFDIAANKVVSNYKKYSYFSGYSADFNLTIWNHKDIDTEIVVDITNNYGDNCQFIWNTPNLKVEKVSAYWLRISRVFKANENISYVWKQQVRE